MSLTLDEARERAALLSDVSYVLHLDLTDRVVQMYNGGGGGDAPRDDAKKE